MQVFSKWLPYCSLVLSSNRMRRIGLLRRQAESKRGEASGGGGHFATTEYTSAVGVGIAVMAAYGITAFVTGVVFANRKSLE
jgi:hypothetical protein